MDQWDQKLVRQRSQFDSRKFLFLSCVYQELNKRLLKTQEYKYYSIFVVYCTGPLTVIYNMYKSMTSCGVHL